MKIIKSLLASTIPIILMYLGNAFISVSFNMNDFTAGQRAGISIYGIALGVLVYFIAYYNKSENNK